jgi:hypothetical protein
MTTITIAAIGRPLLERPVPAVWTAAGAFDAASSGATATGVGGVVACVAPAAGVHAAPHWTQNAWSGCSYFPQVAHNVSMESSQLFCVVRRHAPITTRAVLRPERPACTCTGAAWVRIGVAGNGCARARDTPGECTAPHPPQNVPSGARTFIESQRRGVTCDRARVCPLAFY